MRNLLIALLLLSSTTASHAERPSTLSMSCRQAQSVVARSGAIVMSTGRNTFDRFVASDRYCLPGEWADRAWAPTKDTSHCPIGYICKTNPPFWFDEDGLRGGFLFGR
jgi:hypothetical protein